MILGEAIGPVALDADGNDHMTHDGRQKAIFMALIRSAPKGGAERLAGFFPSPTARQIRFALGNPDALEAWVQGSVRAKGDVEDCPTPGHAVFLRLLAAEGQAIEADDHRLSSEAFRLVAMACEAGDEARAADLAWAHAVLLGQPGALEVYRNAFPAQLGGAFAPRSLREEALTISAFLRALPGMAEIAADRAASCSAGEDPIISAQAAIDISGLSSSLSLLSASAEERSACWSAIEGAHRRILRSLPQSRGCRPVMALTALLKERPLLSQPELSLIFAASYGVVLARARARSGERASHARTPLRRLGSVLKALRPDKLRHELVRRPVRSSQSRVGQGMVLH